MNPKKLLVIIIPCMSFIALFAAGSGAAGITADAGLTPPKGRWVLRAQMRYVQRANDPASLGRNMDMYGFPIVLAYGIRSDLTLMVRQAVMHMEMSSIGAQEKNTGLGDLFILAKYKAYRINTPDYTLGIAPTFGLECDTGKDPFTSGTWDPSLGLYASWRSGPWGSDLNLSYCWNGLAVDENSRNPGDELSSTLALARQFNLSENAAYALAPVFELTYLRLWPDHNEGLDVSNTGESVFYLSPGVKFTSSSIILETLVQIPLWQEQEGYQLERSIGALAGIRLMF